MVWYTLAAARKSKGWVAATMAKENNLSDAELKTLETLVDLHLSTAHFPSEEGVVMYRDLAVGLGIVAAGADDDDDKYVDDFKKLWQELRFLQSQNLIKLVEVQFKGWGSVPTPSAFELVRRVRADAARSKWSKIKGWVLVNLKKGAEQTVQKFVYLVFAVIGGMLGAVILDSCSDPQLPGATEPPPSESRPR